MTSQYPIRLLFAEQVGPVERARIEYAFRVFCAFYGFAPGTGTQGPILGYGFGPGQACQVRLHAGYRARPLREPAPKPAWMPLARHGNGRGEFPCFHGMNSAGQPDWLGETFEWLSGAHEFSVQQTDTVGRIPYAASLHGRYGLDPLLPYAAIALRELNREIRPAAGPDWPAVPINPWRASTGCALAVTHDVDFLPLTPRRDAYRLLKNVGIAMLAQRDLNLALRLLGRCLRVLAGDRALLDTVGAVLGREKQRGIRSSWYVISRRAHRRDGAYDLEHPAVRRHLARLVRAGAEIGVHGSYTSLETSGRLAAEYGKLRRAGYPVVGSRQHWLRYRTPNRLLEEIRSAGGWYDCSFGYRARPGFRQGACFPYPPYDFASETAFPLLELPLVIMDVTLDGLRRGGQDPLAVSRRVLDAVRNHGWGGPSILWHDTTFGAAAVSPAIAALYWDLPAAADLWLPAAELVETVWPRYAEAGLVPARLPVPVESNA